MLEFFTLAENNRRTEWFGPFLFPSLTQFDSLSLSLCFLDWAIRLDFTNVFTVSQNGETFKKYPLRKNKTITYVSKW